MILEINNVQAFVADFLTPVSKVNENCILKITNTGYQTVVTSADNVLILYAVYGQKNNIESDISLNIADISKLVKILNCLDEDKIELIFKGNNLQYISDNINFTYHLLADGILSNPGIDIKKIKDLEFDFKFNIANSTILTLLRVVRLQLKLTKYTFIQKITQFMVN